MPVKAIYFDGQHAKRHEAQLDIRFGRVLVTGDDVARDEPVGEGVAARVHDLRLNGLTPSECWNFSRASSSS